MNTIETSHTRDRGYTGDAGRGASLGRGSVREDVETVEPFNLRRIHLDSGGYDRGGAYWGHGGILWEAFNATEYMTVRVWSGDAHRSAIAHLMRKRFGDGWAWGNRVRLPKRYAGDCGAWLDRKAAMRHVREVYPSATFKRK